MLTNAAEAQRDAFAGDRFCSGVQLPTLDSGEIRHCSVRFAVMKYFNDFEVLVVICMYRTPSGTIFLC